MATYAPFWGLAVGAYALQNNRADRIRMVEKLFRGQSMRVQKAIMQALLGAAVGGTATANRNRITAVQGIGAIDNMGGKRTIETVSLINRATTAADLATSQLETGTRGSYPGGNAASLVAGVSQAVSNAFGYPIDKSGNGGVALSGSAAGKLGF